MRRKHLFVLSVSVVAVVGFLLLHTFGIIDTGTRLEFKTIGKGISSGITNHEYSVIQDSDEWAHIWSKHQQIMYPQDPLPEIDFSKKAIIAVFMGTCPTTGYEIEVKQVIDTGLTIVVKIEKKHPSEECAVGESLTHPYHIVEVDKISKHIIFDTSTGTNECVKFLSSEPS